MSRRTDRRSPLWRWLARALVAIGLLTLASTGFAAWVWVQAPVSTVGELAFTNPLQIPPVNEGRREGGRVVFDLELEAGRTPILDGERTETWGLNGTHLAPTLRARRGDEVTVNVTNGVQEPSTLHWHGMRLPAAADGGPHQLIEPGRTWSPSWTIDQQAATLWFHPHLHGATAEHVYRGVAGLFIVDDAESDDLGLPDDYGVDDVPLILQDVAFDGDNQLREREPRFSNVGVLGDQTLVNGVHDPHLEVTTERVRLRVLNAANARVYDLRFDDGRDFDLIGTDGGLLPEPVAASSLLLSPGERAEILVSLDPGERTVLRSESPDLGLDPWNHRFNGGEDRFDLLELRAADALVPSPPLPDTLVTVAPPEEDEAATTRTFALGNSEINGREMDLGRVDEVVPVDSVEVWEVTNDHGLPHSFHPHLVHFAVLDVDGSPPPPHLRGWKDTIYVPPGTTFRIIARFDGYADEATPYMFHCHVLQHEDAGMMGQFVVVEPGDRPPDRLVEPGDHHLE